VCVCVTECDQYNNKPIHLQWIGRKGYTKKEKRKKEKKERKIELLLTTMMSVLELKATDKTQDDCAAKVLRSQNIIKNYQKE